MANALSISQHFACIIYGCYGGRVLPGRRREGRGGEESGEGSDASGLSSSAINSPCCFRRSSVSFCACLVFLLMMHSVVLSMGALAINHARSPLNSLMTAVGRNPAAARKT